MKYNITVRLTPVTSARLTAYEVDDALQVSSIHYKSAEKFPKLTSHIGKVYKTRRELKEALRDTLRKALNEALGQ